MMHLQLGIQRSLRPTSKSESGSHGEGSRMMFKGMSGSVQFVSRIRESTRSLQVYYNPCPFRTRNGKAFLWTSSLVYHECKEEIPFMWW